MRPNMPRILLVGRDFAAGSSFMERLCRSGCDCQVAHSFDEAQRSLDAGNFDLVLSEIALPDGSAYPLLNRLEGSRTTLYFFLGVSDGCWWLPALSAGRRIWGQPAMRPPEFTRVLELLVGDLEPVAAVGDADRINVVPMPPAERTPPKPMPSKVGKTQARKTSA